MSLARHQKKSVEYESETVARSKANMSSARGEVTGQ